MHKNEYNKTWDYLDNINDKDSLFKWWVLILVVCLNVGLDVGLNDGYLVDDLLDELG